MLSFLADENFNNDIIRGLAARIAHLDIVRVQDVGLDGAEDPMVLQWAAEQGRILLTHDLRTMPAFAAERMKQGQPMPGIIRVAVLLPVGKAIDDLELLTVCSDPADLENQIEHVPLSG